MPRSLEPITIPPSPQRDFVTEASPASPLSDEYFSAEDAPGTSLRDLLTGPSIRGVPDIPIAPSTSGPDLAAGNPSEAQLPGPDLEEEVPLLRAQRASPTDSLHESRSPHAAPHHHLALLTQGTATVAAERSVDSGSSSRAETALTRRLRQRVATLEMEIVQVERGSEEKDARIAGLEFRLRRQARDLRRLMGAVHLRDARYALLVRECEGFLVGAWPGPGPGVWAGAGKVEDKDEEFGEGEGDFGGGEEGGRRRGEEGKGKKEGWVKRMVNRRGK